MARIELRLHDMQLACQPRGRVLDVLRPELEAIRPVDGEWVDRQSLERLENGLPGSAEEGDAFLDLRGLGRVLQEEDVGERMPRSQHGDAELVAGACELVGELVDLGDRLPQIAVVDLVGGHGGGHEVRLPFSLSGPFP